jgi:hypothetical protein
MVEVHRKERKPPLTVGARDIAQLLKQRGLLPAKLTFGRRRVTRIDAHSPTSQCPRVGTSSMAIRANDVALFELGNEPGPRDRACSLQEPEHLVVAFPVIEVHGIGKESAAAVGAGHVPKIAQELHRFLLTRPNAFELLGSMGLVVGNVVRSLIPLSIHAETVRTPVPLVSRGFSRVADGVRWRLAPATAEW